MMIARYPTRLIIFLALLMVAIAYLLQIASPLRLVNDGVDYLLQASSAIDGNGFLVHGVRSMRPPGYPALIWVLAKSGIGTSWAIVALNCFFLGVGCVASYFVLRDSFGFSPQVAQFISLLTLLSFLMIRNVTYPLSDICFFGMSVPCLLVLIRAEADAVSRRLWWLLLIIPFLFFCIELRTIGIVFIPAFIWAAIGGVAGARRIYPVLRQHRVLTCGLLLIALVVASRVLLDSRYMHFNAHIFQRRGVLRSVAANIGYHTAEWGEMTANAPASKLPAALGLPVQILGAFAILACVVGLWAKRDRPDSLWVYLLGFGSIVFIYPWNDARLWLPVLPFLMGYVLLGLRRMLSPGVLNPLLVVYCSLFCMLGLLALGFSTRLTFAGARFPDIYGDGNFRNAYRIVLRGETPNRGDDVNQDALYLLRRYEWRAAGK
jgi:hypothetical protein